MTGKVCPSCGSTHVKRSHRRNIGEYLLKIINRKPYRCVDCDWRGIMWGGRAYDYSGVSKKKDLTKIQERILMIINRKTYRSVDYDSRGSLWGRAHDYSRASNKKHLTRIHWLLIIAFALLIAFMIIMYVQREQEQSAALKTLLSITT